MEEEAKDCKLKIRSKDNFKNRFFFQIYLKIKGLLRLHRNLTSNVFTCQRYMHKDTSRKDSNIWFEILNICLYTKLQDMLWVLLMTFQMSVWFFFVIIHIAVWILMVLKVESNFWWANVSFNLIFSIGLPFSMSY